MQIHESIDVSSWEGATRSKVQQYWEERGFKLKTSDETTMSGVRGDWLSAILSPIISSVRTELRIRCEDGSHLECSIEINTRLRTLSESQRRFLEFELEAFKSFLLTGDRSEVAWAVHRQNCKYANIEMTVDILAYPFRKRKSRKPLPIASNLTLQSWLFGGLGVLLPLFMFALFYITPKIHLDHPDRPLDDLAIPRITAGMAGVIWVALAVWTYGIKRSSKMCVSVQQAGVLYSMDTEAMRKAIEQRGVKAKFILEGEPIYDLDDVSATTLLRPIRDHADELLLMPVNEVMRKADDLLVRPATDSLDSVAVNSMPESQVTVTINRQ